MKKLTVFTPTFNRKHLLPRLYKSLRNQTSKDFVWLVIDDGSIDYTDALVRQWIKDAKIEIEYYYKPNGGMHTGHNAAYQLIDTELNVCIDSDDYMPKDGVEKIIKQWNEVNRKDHIAGIIGLDAEENGQIIGTKIPQHLKYGTLADLYTKYGITGDKKVVLRTDIVKRYPAYPEYKYEKLVPLGLLYLMIGQDYDFIYSNDVYCIVEYQPEGSSSSILEQYRQSPRGFAYARMIQKKYSKSVIDDLKNSAHLVSSALFTKDISLLFSGPKVYQNVLMMPFGLLLHSYILFKIK